MAARFGRRLRRGTTAAAAVAALALAAMTASEAPGATGSGVNASDRGAKGAPQPPDAPIDGGSPYYTGLPPLNSPVPPGKASNGPIVIGSAEAGIPATVLDAYKKAEAAVAETQPGCRLPWQLLAAIGKVESGHARGGAVDAEGNTLQPIRGPQLNGNGFAAITDSDGGALDGDALYDRAMGPMQFIPSTWAKGGPDGLGWGADGNGDGKKDPDNIYDAALAAGRYLCANGRDLSVREDLEKAILGYNRSEDYLRTVLSWYEYYRKGTHEVPDGSGVLPVRRGGSAGPAGSAEGGGGAGRDRSAGPTPGPSGSATPGGPGSSGPSSKPTGPTGPTGPTRPSGPSGPGSTTPPPGNGGEPGTTPPPTTTPPPKPNPGKPTTLERVGDRQRSATAGEEFAEPLRVRAKSAAGKALPEVRVQYAIVGATDARFEGGAERVTVATGSDGVATAPKLLAGERPGLFTVRATVVGSALVATDFTAVVKPAPVVADALSRTSDKALSAGVGSSFADRVEVRATYKGKPVAGVELTATMIGSASREGATAGADKGVTAGAGAAARAVVESDKGPYFKNAKGETVRSLVSLRTDADGLLKLPRIYTDDRSGTFRLRLATTNGVVLTLELTVEKPATP